MGDPIETPVAPGNSNTVTAATHTFSQVKVVSLTFSGDHGLLKDNSADWANTGTVFTKPEFTYGKKSAPVSYTKGSAITVAVELEVWPADAPSVSCNIEGFGDWGQGFKTTASLKGGKQTLTIKSDGSLPNTLTKDGTLPDVIGTLTGDIQWTVSNASDGFLKAGASWGHEILLTLGTPLTDKDGETDSWGNKRQEDGVTYKRMKAALEWSSAAPSPPDPHEIMKTLRTRFPEYTLTPDPDLAAVDHPRFFLKGPWPLAEVWPKRAECQAQVRLERAILRQLGTTAQIKIVMVYANPEAPTTAREDDWDAYSNGGLNDSNSSASRTKNGMRQFAFLSDSAVVVGQTYTPGTSGAPGLNHYEACLVLTTASGTKYYGGGGDVYDNADQVINGSARANIAPCFWGLVWIEADNDSADSPFKVVEIAKQYTQGP
jgi:hypothetical protein